MRADYWNTSVPLQLAVTKPARKKLVKIQSAYFPSFSQSSVVKILVGIYLKRHRVKLLSERDDPMREPPPLGKDHVNLIDYNQDDLRLIWSAIKSLSKEGKRMAPTALLSAIVESL